MIRLLPLYRNLVLCVIAAASACVIGLPVRQAAAAEVRLKPTASVTGGLVTLGDIADISSSYTTEANRLARLQVGTVTAGRQLRLSQRAVQDYLTLAGVDWREVRLGGAATVTVSRASCLSSETAAFPAAADRPRRTDAADNRFYRGLKPVGYTQAVTNATDPVAADTVPVVVAARSLLRGQRISQSDIELQPRAAAQVRPEMIQNPADVIGKEVVHSVTAGQPLRDRSVREPLLVKRNEIVTVYSRTPSVTVTATARALQDGSEGELITLQSLTDNNRLSAVVTGVQETTVYARSARTTPLTQSATAAAGRRTAPGTLSARPVGPAAFAGDRR
jgi:flagella basal body P-ring formation protein FlgA